ncbi:MAG: NHL repeat-containing protein, partial [Patescibacteria group bacterium]
MKKGVFYKILLLALIFSQFPTNFAQAFSNGANALDALGNLDEAGVVSYRKVGQNGGPFNNGMASPDDVAIDSTNHRLFVSDYQNGRVLVYNLNSSDVLVDYTADYVLGRPDFNDTRSLGASDVTQNTLVAPTGLAYASNMLYVSEGIANRVVVFDVTTIVNGESAANVLGQASFTTYAEGTTQSTLYNPSGLAIASNLLYVADTTNNRVMIFDVTAILDGENAANELGQANFTTVEYSKKTSSRLNQPEGVEISGTTLYVADTANHRVVTFDVTAISDGEAATFVLGQTAFGLNSSGTTISKFKYPKGLSLDASSLFVSDADNDRVMVFNISDGVTNGESAINVLGQADFTSDVEGVSQTLLQEPKGSALISTKLYISDYTNSRVMVFDIAVLGDGEAADNVIGQFDDDTGAASYTKGGQNNGASKSAFYGVEGSAIDTTNHRLFVSDSSNCRILVFNLDTDNTILDYKADKVLGQTDFASDACETYTPTSTGLTDPRGIAYASNKLYVADNRITYDTGRILIYDVTDITNGEAAEHVLGQKDFIGTANDVLGQEIVPTDVTISSNTLFVSDAGYNRVLVYDVTAVSDGESAANVLGAEDMVTSGGYTTTADTFYVPTGLATDGTYLFVVDSGNYRLLIFNITAISNGEDAVNVLGQANFTTGTDQGVAQNTLYAPSGVAYSTNKLYVSDQANRVMVFDVTAISDNENAANVLGQANFTSSTAGTGQNDFSYSTYLSAGSDLLYATDSGNNRVMIFDVAGSSNTAPTTTVPTASEATNGTGKVTVSAVIDDTDDDNTLQFLV